VLQGAAAAAAAEANPHQQLLLVLLHCQLFAAANTRWPYLLWSSWKTSHHLRLCCRMVVLALQQDIWLHAADSTASGSLSLLLHLCRHTHKGSRMKAPPESNDEQAANTTMICFRN
jgi:hypothetical protein